MDENQPYKLPDTAKGLTEEDVRAIVQSMLQGITGSNSIVGGFLKSSNFVTGVSGWQLRPDGAEIQGALTVTSINIPDTSSANSFHVESDGDTFWGCTPADFTSNNDNAPAYILKTGFAKFQNVMIGGTAVQYVITNSGIFSYGDGSDGTATCDGSTAVAGMSRSGSTYSLTRDVYFNTLTIDAGVTVKTQNYRIFCSVAITINGTVQCNGNNGTDATGVSGGAPAGVGGAAIPGGYFKASAAGGNGGAGGVGGSTTHSLGSNGGGGGGGGAQLNPAHVGGSGAAGGTATPANVTLIANWHLATLLDIDTGAASATGVTALFTSGGGGGGGGDAGNGTFGRGGGGGSAAGVVAIYAKSITIGAAGVISANGGNGGSDASTGGGSGGGGGGGGGAGGLVVLVYNSLTNNGSITVTGGTGGNGGPASAGYPGPGTCVAPGGNGTNGGTGSIYQFQLSL